MHNLLTTIVICLGMSNGMPISSYEEKKNHVEQIEIQPKYVESNETQINNYTLSIQPNNLVTTSYADNLETRKANIANNNSYINILGNSFIQSQYRTYPGATYYYAVNIANYTYYSNNSNDVNDQYAPYMLKMGNILKITPYNYNINNTVNLTFTYYIAAVGDFNAIYARYRIYQTTQNWDSYIGMQPRASQVYYIENEITNVNNNYYYNYTEITDQIAANYLWGNITKQISIELTPNQDNYIYITVEPLIGWNEDPNEPIMENIEYMFSGSQTCMWWYENWTISGTNIVPPSSYEVIDLPGLMFEILGMPFAFVSQAFDLTLFPGTPYQVNISNLFLAIIALLVFIFLIKIIVSASSKG